MSTKLKIVMTPGRLNRVDLYEAAGFEVVEGNMTTEDEMIELMHDADAAQVGVLPLTTRRVLENCPKLKAVSRFGVGVDSIDLEAATELGVLVCNVPGSNTSEVADHAMAMLLAMTRCIVPATNAVNAGAWQDNPRETGQYYFKVRRIAGQTVGIIGFGDIGRAFASRVRGFGPKRIIAYDPYVSQLAGDLYGVEMVDLNELVSQADFVTIHCSSTDETRHLINAETLSLMKPTALLINTARGAIVSGDALAEALQTGAIAGAALDVTETEPVPSDHPLLRMSNCIVTPHVAGFSSVFLADCAQRQAENLIFALTGKAPHGLANPEVIKTIAVMRANNSGRWLGIPDFSTALRL